MISLWIRCSFLYKNYSIYLILLLSVLACNKETLSIGESDLRFDYLIQSNEDLEEYFALNERREIIISGHRGGSYVEYPENCIETFDNLMSFAPFFFEVDPRLTADDQIVLMHDETIDRTTTGSGKLRAYGYEDLHNYYLRDPFGNVTKYHIPLLRDVIIWSQSRCILNFDHKDVPIRLICEMVNDLEAKNCIFTVHSVSEAQELLCYIPDAHFSVFMGTMEKFLTYKEANLLSHIVIAYLENSIVQDYGLLLAIHNEGIRTMVSTASIEGKSSNDTFRREVISSGPDIIETDYPTNYVNFEETRRFWK